MTGPVKQERFDVVVAGGGMAGVCAAIASARQGARTALVQDRPVLGGNASSEMRVWTVGATAMGRNRYAAETGIIGELDLENLYRNPEGNPYIWDSILLDFVTREKNLTLYFNTTVLDVLSNGQRMEKLLAYRMTTEDWLELESSFFIDCTGDGSMAVKAGVPYMHGRESKVEFGESLAPEKKDAFTLGNTLLLYSRDAGKKIPYHAPDFAYDIDYIRQLIVGNDKPLSLHTSGCDFWWLETGGSSDTIKDGDDIRFELQKLVYGIWNYVKNSGEYEADNLELEWIGNLPAKRESRRLVGAYILTQNDILEHRDFDDAVCSGGWPIDTHPPGGIYSRKEACEQRDAGVYQIPLRSLYSTHVKNVFFAGRNISASHLAFATTRVMKTCAVMGQAAGTAAALCAGWDTLPGDLTADQVAVIQRTLLQNDQWIPHDRILREQGGRLPRAVGASGYRAFANDQPARMLPLTEEVWIMLPPLGGSTIELWMQGGEGIVEIFSGKQRHACADMTLLATRTLAPKEGPGWVAVMLPENIPEEKDLFLRIPAMNAKLGISDLYVPGCVGSVGKRTGLRIVDPCFRLAEDPGYFAPEALLTYHTRPTTVPNMWVSRPLVEEAAWLEWDVSEQAKQLQICFDADLSRDYNQLRPDYYGNGWDAMPPYLARDFRILTQENTGLWTCLGEYRDHHRRCIRCTLTGGVRRVRLEILRTWGAPCAAVQAVRFF